MALEKSLSTEELKRRNDASKAKRAEEKKGKGSG